MSKAKFEEEFDPLGADEDEESIEKQSEEALESITKGMDTGLKQGMRAGVKEGMKPIAEKVAAETMKNILEGGTRSPVSKTIEEISEIARVQALQNYVDSLKMKSQPQPQPQPQQNPQNQLFESLAALSKLGINTNQLVEMLGTNTIISLMNPQLAPLIMATRQNDKQSNSSDGGMSAALITMLMQQQRPQERPQSNGNDQLVVALLQQQSQLQAKLFEVQAQAQETQQRLLMEQLRPMLNRHTPSIGEELEELKEKVDAFKSIGLFGNSAPSNEFAAEYDFKTRQLAIELEREKLKMQQEMAFRQQQMEMENKKEERIEKMIGTATNFLKNVNIQIPRPSPQSVQQQMATAPVGNAPANISEHITQRVDNMLRMSFQGKKPQRVAEERFDDDDEE